MSRLFLLVSSFITYVQCQYAKLLSENNKYVHKTDNNVKYGIKSHGTVTYTKLWSHFLIRNKFVSYVKEPYFGRQCLPVYCIESILV